MGSHKFPILACQIRNLNHMPFHDCPARVSLSDALVGRFDLMCVEALSSYILQPSTSWLGEQYGGGIYIKLFDHLIDQYCQCDLQIKNAANSQINRAKSSQP